MKDSKNVFNNIELKLLGFIDSEMAYPTLLQDRSYYKAYLVGFLWASYLNLDRKGDFDSPPFSLTLFNVLFNRLKRCKEEFFEYSLYDMNKCRYKEAEYIFYHIIITKLPSYNSEIKETENYKLFLTFEEVLTLERQ